jgi:beta-galactosidase
MAREQILWNKGWKFRHGDFPAAAAPAFDDSAWADICLPHSFGIPYFMEGQFYVGYGCYRKSLFLPQAWLGKRVALEFQAAFQAAEVYVNGQLAGSHKGGYTPFAVDMTELLRPGENLVFVRVNNLWDSRQAPRAGEHVFNGGIYRDVSLLVTDPVRVAWEGIWVTTPQASRERALVEVQTEVENLTAQNRPFRLSSVVKYQGEAVAQAEFSGEAAPGKGEALTQQLEVLAPHLWSPESPELYTLETTLSVEGQEPERQETTFGVRWFAFTAKEGFFLNGEPYKIHGANVHQDHAGWSDAVTHTGIARDVKLIKDCGMNFIRGSHYPHHTVFAQECDRQGVLFWSENCFWGTGGPKQEGYWTASAYPIRQEDEAEFEESCLRSLEEMIRANRNHPSIVVWSMCNEPFFTDAGTSEKMKALLQKLVAASHRLDPTRPAAIGGAQRGGIDVLGDVAGYNGDGAAIFHDPGFPNFVSEYGSSVSDRPGNFAPNYTDGVEQPHPWRSGISLWCGFHHGSILFDMGHMGMIDYYRLPLDTWHWYRENLLGIPRPEHAVEGRAARLSLTADRLELTDDGTQDVQLVVSLLGEDGRRVLSPQQVRLEVVSGGAVFPTGKVYEMSGEKGSLLDGMGAIELRALYPGETVIRAQAEGVPPVELQLLVTGDSPWDGRELVPLPAPPSVMAPPPRQALDEIGLYRPVFASGEDPQCPAKNVTDGQWETCWKPASPEAGQWVMVDLEGTKDVEGIHVVFRGMVQHAVEVALSHTREDFRTIYNSGERPAVTDVSLDNLGQQARFIRVRFPGETTPICKIEVFA